MVRRLMVVQQGSWQKPAQDGPNSNHAWALPKRHPQMSPQQKGLGLLSQDLAGSGSQEAPQMAVAHSSCTIDASNKPMASWLQTTPATSSHTRAYRDTRKRTLACTANTHTHTGQHTQPAEAQAQCPGGLTACAQRVRRYRGAAIPEPPPLLALLAHYTLCLVLRWQAKPQQPRAGRPSSSGHEDYSPPPKH